MKKLFAMLLSLVLICAPIFFTGCGKEYSISKISTNADSMVQDASVKDYFTVGTITSFKNPMSVVYSSTAINNALNDNTKVINIIKKVYEPMLEIAGSFYTTTVSTFKTWLTINDDIDVPQELVDKMGTTLDELGDTLTEFADAHKNFEKRESGDGYALNNYLIYYKELIKDTFNFNMAYADVFIKYVFTYKDYTSDTASGLDITSEPYYYTLYDQLLLGDIAFMYNVYNYLLPNDPTTITDVDAWLNGSDREYLKELLDYRTVSKSKNFSAAGADSNKLTNIKNALACFQREKVVFDKDTSLFLKSLKKFNYTEYFLVVGDKNLYVEGKSDLEQASYYFAQNYLKYNFSAQIGWLDMMYDMFYGD